jgi:hypothetical protein
VKKIMTIELSVDDGLASWLQTEVIEELKKATLSMVKRVEKSEDVGIELKIY